MYRYIWYSTEMYIYIRDKTKRIYVHDACIQTGDLVHSKHFIPLRYDRERYDDIGGSYKVVLHYAGQS